HEVPVDDRRLIDERRAALLRIELALRHGGDPSPLDAPGRGQDLDAVTDRRDGLLRREEAPRETQEVLVVAKVLGGATARQEEPRVLLGTDIAKADRRL